MTAANPPSSNMDFKFGICTMSLGSASGGHSIERKLDAAAECGAEGVEVFYEDLLAIAADTREGQTVANQLAAAKYIYRLCEERGLKVICLQPLRHFEGVLSEEQHRADLKTCQLFIKLARQLHTDLVVIPSNFLPAHKLSATHDLSITHLREAADLGARSSPPVRFAYEALCWGTRVKYLEEVRMIVDRVGRDNFGYCLDTFNIAGAYFADPTQSTGVAVGGEPRLRNICRYLDAVVDPSKVFLVQVADAERLEEPISPRHPWYKADQPARMTWSRNARLFYGEERFGGYLPVTHVLNAIIRGLGYRGWLSFEVFNRRLNFRDIGIPNEMALRASLSWVRMLQDLKLDKNLLQDSRPGEVRAPTCGRHQILAAEGAVEHLY